MCFDTQNTNALGSVTASGVPVPGRKPAFTVSSSDGSIIDKIFNAGANVFDRIATIELEKFETERLLDIREVEEQAKLARQKELAGKPTSFSAPQQTAAIGASSLLAIAFFGTAFILMARR